MRRESSTIVVLVGDTDDALTACLKHTPNVSVARAPESDATRLGWEPGALALREAMRQRSTYVVVPDDPLAGVAAGWQAMWDLSGGSAGPGGFEQSVAEALTAWHDKRFELPDYYLVAQAPQPDRTGVTRPSMYLGPLRAARPRRVAVAGMGAPEGTDPHVRAARIIEALRALQHGPWWPPLDDLLDAARTFYAGGLAQTQPL